MIKIILFIGVITIVFSGCVGIEEPITKGHTMEINLPEKATKINPIKNTQNIRNPKNLEIAN